ncbi:MAG: DegT/DnrJ/EryC1/StrS family aminotransferase [Dehalococcoidia bacterium]
MIPVTDLSRMHAEIRPALDAAVRRVLDRNWYILGPEVEAFEEAFAAACGVRYAVGCASGTDAITLALRAHGIGPGDEVVLPALTAAPTAGGVVAAGAIPVFADVDPRTRNLDPRAAAAAITPRTRALLPVHLYGRPADMDALTALAQRHSLALIEDAAQAHGAHLRGRPAGSLADAGCFSFYPTKNLGALGDGGMVTTNDPRVAERLRRLRNHGQSSRYRHEEHSANSRLDELQAALLSAKLPLLRDWNRARREQALRYHTLLPDGPVRLPPPDDAAESCWHLYVVESSEREVFRARLHAAGVGSDSHYPVAVHLQPAYDAYGRGPGSLPVCERLANTVVSLPLFPGLTEAEQDRVAAVVRDALAVA